MIILLLELLNDVDIRFADRADLFTVGLRTDFVSHVSASCVHIDLNAVVDRWHHREVRCHAQVRINELVHMRLAPEFIFCCDRDSMVSLGLGVGTQRNDQSKRNSAGGMT